MTFTKLSKYTAILSSPYILFMIALFASGHQTSDSVALFCFVMLVLPPVFALFIDENPFIANLFIAAFLVGFSFILLGRMPLEMP